MSDPSFTGRTFNLALKYGTREAENYNLNKLDDILGNAFTPDSVLQIPDGAITGAQIAPQAITPDLIFVSGTLTQSLALLPTAEKPLTVANGPQTLLDQDMGSTRYGPIFISGNLPILMSSSATSQVAVTLDIHAVIFGVTVPIVSPSLPWLVPSAPQGGALIAFIPLSTFLDCAGNFSGNFSGTHIKIIAQKDSGADATTNVTAKAGIVTLTEFA